MLKRLAVIAAMRDSPTFFVAELAARSGVAENTVQTVLQRMSEGWLDKESVPTGGKGRAPVRYTLTRAGHAGIIQALGRAVSAAGVRDNAPNVDVETDVPLGLASAEDTVKLLSSEENPNRAKALRRDAARDLKWATAELRGKAYQDKAPALRARIEAVKKALREGTPESHTRDVEEAVPERALSHELLPLETEASDFIDAREAAEATPLSETSESIFERWRRRYQEFVGKTRRPLRAHLWPSVETPGFSFTQGRHVVVACLAMDDQTAELALGAKWALNGAIKMARLHGRHTDLAVHSVGPKRLQTLIDEARSHRHALANTTFVFVVNSEGLQEQVERVLSQTHAFGVLKNSQLLDYSFDEHLKETITRLDCHYVPHAADPYSVDWIQGTMAEVSRGVSSLAFDSNVGSYAGARRAVGSSE